ncbi:dual serine/threonine and tyrosine protein kinase-like [Saccostrea cucullata]|uniref:dual serine/threonine and tyrosine protein kinase-like n=1 Tax=Saccostrea cuccullata TaxID=36930 RepID=UPI002ED31C7C
MAGNCDTDDDPAERICSMFSDAKYNKCYKLYKEADEVFTESQLDTLEKLTLQYHMMKDSHVTITEVLQRRMESLKDGQRELRVYIAGEVAVGKSTFLNLLMGGDYLPTDHGSCTNVLCEVHNNPVRLGIIYYGTGQRIDINLPPDSTSDEWNRIQACIKDKTDNQIRVTKVEIYWPLMIFKSMHQTETKEAGRHISGSIDMASDLLESIRPNIMSEVENVDTPKNEEEYLRKRSTLKGCFKQSERRGRLPIIFMDFPGIDSDHQESFKPYLRNVDKCHTFIFMIDIHRDHGVRGPTLQKLMADISDAIAIESSTLDPQTALFVCTNCPESIISDLRRKSDLTDKILARIQMRWPMVVRSQIIFIDNMTKVASSVDRSLLMMTLQREIIDFLIKSERLLLEEHCMWLTRLIECTSAFMKFGNQWKSMEDIIRIDVKTRESLEKVFDFFDRLKTDSSIADKMTSIQTLYEDKIRRYLDHEIQMDELTIKDVMSLRDKISPVLKSFQRACDIEMEYTLSRMRSEIQEKLMYGEFQGTVAQDENSIIDNDKVVLPFVALFLWPVGLGIAAFAIYEFALSIMENDSMSKQNLIKKVVAKIKEHMASNLNKSVQEMNRHRIELVNILNQNKKYPSLKGNTDRSSVCERFNEIAKSLWDVYVGSIMQHEFSSDEIEVHYDQGIGHHNQKVNVYNATIKARKNETHAVKEIQMQLRETPAEDSTKEKGDYKTSLPCDSSIFRERYLLKHLSLKKADEDHPFFVQYEGSAGHVEKGHYHLQLVMKRYKGSLVDVLQCTDQKRRIKYAKAAARGLRFLHKHQVIHRDVKLSNYLVDDDDNVVICDVGHSKHIDSVQTIRGRGTLIYLAPELRDSSIFPHTKASDIYSLGLTLWELINGERIDLERRFEKKISKGKGGGVENLIRACLNPNPKQRPTVFEIVAQLDILYSTTYL